MVVQTSTMTFTGWGLKDSGIGNQWNALTGLTYTRGNWQIAPELPLAEADRGPGALRRAGAGSSAQHPR
jgi:hypothetical protein